LIDLDGCMAKGLIKKTSPSKEQAYASMEKAKILLREARADMEDGRFNSAVMIAYAAILNASRAVESRYQNKISKDQIILLDHYRETRHEVQYEASYLADEAAATQIIAFTERFISLIETLLV
jgi:uncharacterized protein (UPF0332 family)